MANTDTSQAPMPFGSKFTADVPVLVTCKNGRKIHPADKGKYIRNRAHSRYVGLMMKAKNQGFQTSYEEYMKSGVPWAKITISR